MQIEQQERELAYKSRFASNLAYSQSHAINGPSSLIAQNQPAAPSGTSDHHFVRRKSSIVIRLRSAPVWTSGTGTQASNSSTATGSPRGF